MHKGMAKDRLIVALDYSRKVEALSVAGEIKDHVGLFKVGLQLFSSDGADVVRTLRKEGANVFLDLKLHDIPNTVSNAAVVAAGLGVSMMNFHCLGGKKMLDSAVKEVSDYCAKNSMKKPLLIGVTILTSMAESDMREVGIASSLIDEVRRLAAVAREAGMDGVVASVHEIEAVKRECGNDFLVVTPGIRPLWSRKDDQERVTTPSEAIKRGADFIVIGRPITLAPDKRKAAQEILSEMEPPVCS
ncbi:MAG: orotidine-5'-phosphate decarboxylase [Acidobacteriota bacterium]